MPTYSRDTSTAGNLYKPSAQTVAALHTVITMATGDLDANDTFDIGRVPRGAKVLDVILYVTDMDSGAAGLISVGDAGSTGRFISSASIQAAGRLAAGNNATSAALCAAHTAYTAETLIYGTVTTASGTAVAGTISATVLYICEA